MEPPPRARISTSTNFFLIEKLQRLDDFFGGAFALHAHRIDGQMHIRKAARKDAETSRTAAPFGEVMMPMRLEEAASGFLRAASNRPRLRGAFSLLEGELQRALPISSISRRKSDIRRAARTR